MDLITPFDLVDHFPAGARLAIIGNAPTLSGRGLGPRIDAHDMIVRFNDCRVRGFEADVGGRTDILVCNPYAETRPGRVVADEPLPQIILVLTPQTRRGDRETFSRWAGDTKVLFSYTPDIRIDTAPRQAISLTTGTYAVSLLHNLMQPASMFLSGFSMFAPGSDFHYWSTVRPSGLKSHVPASEALVFADLLNSLRCRVEITSEIQDIFSRCSKIPGRHLRLHAAGRPD